MAKKIFIGIAIIFVICCVFYGGMFWEQKFGLKSPAETIVIHDSLLPDKLALEKARDTVKKFYDVIHTLEKEVVKYETKIDSIFLAQEVRPMYVMLKVEKSGNTLFIYAVNQNDSVLAKLVWDDVQRNFTAVSTPAGVIVKSQNFYIDMPYIEISSEAYLKDKKFKFENPEITLKGGLNYKEKIGVGLFSKYNIEVKNFTYGLNFYYKPFR